jgi:hypothetical protein
VDNTDDLEFSDLGRDPRFSDGGWAGFVILLGMGSLVTGVLIALAVLNWMGEL